MDIGVLLDADESAPEELVSLAVAAEHAGVAFLIVDGARQADAFTTATWIVGKTERIRVSAPSQTSRRDPTDAETPFPSVVAKSVASLELLAPDRAVPAQVAWSTVEPGWENHLAELSADASLPVFPIRSIADIQSLAPILAHGTAASTPSNRPQRPAMITAQRVSGIDYDVVPESLAVRAVEPGDANYGRYASTYLRGGQPGLILRPQTVSQVSDAIAFARNHTRLPLGVRSAGHGISGRSTNHDGLVIHVGDMDELEVLDKRKRLVRVGPGRTWKRVAHALAPHGWAIGSGDYGGVGVGGLATAGGIGFLSREQGLTIDRLRAVELVLADGTPIRASATENSDLFWAVRGAGANFGIATAFEFEAAEIGHVGWAQLVLVTDDIEASLRRYGELASQAPRDTTVFFVTGRQRGGRWVVSLFGVVDNPDADVVESRLTPFLELGQLARQPDVVMTTYAGVMDNAADVGPGGQQGFGEPVSRSAFVPEMTDDLARDLAELLSDDLVYFLELRAMGGAISDAPSDAMAFPHRSQKFQLAAMSSSDDLLSAKWSRLQRHFHGSYLSFETDRDPARLAEAFTPSTLARLRQLKAKYDPDNLFRDNFNIPPDFTDADEQNKKAGAA